jgi:hypothetical protein
MSDIYLEESRQLQDQYDTRRLADRHPRGYLTGASQCRRGAEIIALL